MGVSDHEVALGIWVLAYKRVIGSNLQKVGEMAKPIDLPSMKSKKEGDT